MHNESKKFTIIYLLTILVPILLLFFLPNFRDSQGILSYPKNKVVFFYLIMDSSCIFWLYYIQELFNKDA